MTRLPLRVAVIGTNDPQNFSGGRYHGLMIAYAVAAAGGEAHVVTDCIPAFAADLDPLVPGGVQFHTTADFATGLPDGPFDWVVVIPTGIFLPDFYENALDFAGAVGARLCFVNFESANWFNQDSPVARDPRTWDGWQRLCLRGALVLSSTRLSDRHARPFYGKGEGRLRFEVWSPPVNAVAARRSDGLPKDGSLLAFVRPQDAHKGASLLTEIDPALLAGRTLRLVCGRDIPPDFEAALTRHLARAPGARLDIQTRITDLQKFRMLTAAQAVLFPSRFEGFGYPPVEAAYAGTESVCFRLPVLDETVGRIAQFAEGEDAADFSLALARALGEPERRVALRAAVHSFADFDAAALLLGDVLLRAADALEPLAPRSWRVAIGPWATTEQHPAARIVRDAPLPPAPPIVRSACLSTGGDVLIGAVAFLRPGFEGIEAANPGGPALPLIWTSTPEGAFERAELYLSAPGGILDRRISLAAHRGDRLHDDPLELQVDRVTPADPERPVRCGISESVVRDGHRLIRGWVLAREPLTELLYTPDGDSWTSCTDLAERSDIDAAYPNYPSPLCGFALDLPADPQPHPRHARLLCIADGRAIDLLVGWPPAPVSGFAEDVTLGPAVPKPAPSSARSPAQPGVAAVLRPMVGLLDLVDLSDADWTRGVARHGNRGRLGAVCVAGHGTQVVVQPGMVLRFATGAARRVIKVEAGPAQTVLVLNGPLPAAGNGFPGRVALHAAEDPEFDETRRSFTVIDWSDAHWLRGMWNGPEHRRRMIFLPAGKVRELGIAAGTRLGFAASGVRTVLETIPTGSDVILRLDGPIRPTGDGAPKPVQVLTPGRAAQAGGFGFSLARAAQGWPGGIRARGPDEADWASDLLLEPAAGLSVRPGTALRRPDGRMMRVLATRPAPDGLEVTVQGRLDPALDGHPALLLPVAEADIPDGLRAAFRTADAGYGTSDPLYLDLLSSARRRGEVLPELAPPAAGTGRRVLFLTLVPPTPATQGNRVVTRNLIHHLLDLGFEVDVVLQGWLDGCAALHEFGDRVRVLAVPFPRWQDSDAVRQRGRVAAAAAALAANGQDGALADALEEAAEQFHPFFIVRDETVEMARSLFARHRYDAIVCNYTHMVRVVEELGRIAPLPPVAIVTHDALSRLPRAFGGRKLDLMYRACPAPVERDVLDAVSGAAIVAISRSEAAYFRQIGVANPVVLCEYDAAEEMAPAVVREANFGRRTIVFHGSANPMNLAGLDWFLDECWSEVVAAVPDVRLVICGKVGTVWNPGLAGIEITGELDRDAMIARCGAASITINPCVAGTGLKIKTVEAACLGLPAVCLPTAVDGLEEVAGQFAVVATDGPEFTAGCIGLLTDGARWARLHRGALALARDRFSTAMVYRALDAAMGWDRGTAWPQWASAPADAWLTGDDGEPGSLLDLGLRLTEAGQSDLGRRLMENIARQKPGDAALAADVAAHALAEGEPWAAVLYGTRVIGARPEEPAGYWLVGQGLLALGLREHAVPCLTQGVLVAPHDQRLLTALVDALAGLGRAEEAARWRGLQPADAGLDAGPPSGANPWPT